MQPECPEWAAYIGAVIRLMTNEPHHLPSTAVDLLRQIDEREAALGAALEAALEAKGSSLGDRC